MSDDKRTALLNEANELGLEFPANIKTTKLEGMVAEAKGEPIPVDEVAPPSPAMKAEEPTEEMPEEMPAETPVKKTTGKVMSQRDKIRAAVAKAKKKALSKRVVTITNKDNRENDVMTTAYLSFENQYFGLSRLVPLDIPVELEEALIHIAESTMMTLHKDEIVDGKRTGNKVPVRVKKFAVSYSNIEPK